jgi:hypothetical protein
VRDLGFEGCTRDRAPCHPRSSQFYGNLELCLELQAASRLIARKERAMPVPFSSALYYPHMDIRDERWLRSAVLFWDSIRTIVPESYREPYSSPFARELNDMGVLVPVRVSSDMDEIEALTDTVLDFLTDPATAGMMLAYDPETGGTRGDVRTSHNLLSELANIHPMKLPRKIRLHLERTDESGWLEVDRAFRNFYMTLLATRLAHRLGLGLITGSNEADQLAIAVHKGKPLATPQRRRVGSHYDASGPRRALPSEVAPGFLFDLVVQSIELPENIAAKDLLKFKNEHHEELAVFRREVGRLATDLPEGTSVEALRQIVRDYYEGDVRHAMKSLRHSVGAQSWETALNGFLKISFFSTPTSAAISYAGVVPPTVALLVGVGMSLTASAVLLVNQRARAKLDSPYSYLLSLSQQW